MLCQQSGTVLSYTDKNREKIMREKKTENCPQFSQNENIFVKIGLSVYETEV